MLRIIPITLRLRGAYSYYEMFRRPYIFFLIALVNKISSL